MIPSLIPRALPYRARGVRAFVGLTSSAADKRARARTHTHTVRYFSAPHDRWHAGRIVKSVCKGRADMDKVPNFLHTFFLLVALLAADDDSFIFTVRKARCLPVCLASASHSNLLRFRATDLA